VNSVTVIQLPKWEMDLPAVTTIWIMLIAAAVILIGILEILDS